MPLISVLLPTYSRNASNHLRNAIESVLAQDIRDFELLVVDDGSTDGSSETIIEIASRDSRVKHIRFERNVGLPALTCAEAFRQSSGNYIAWQFDDCEWTPTLLSSLLSAAQENPDAGLIYGQAEMSIGNSSIILGEEFNRETLTQRNIIPNCATLIRREVFQTLGWLDPSIILKRTCDYDMWLRISRHYQIAYVNKVVATENGLSLPDSLGNSVTLISALAKKYQEHDRSKYLQIDNLKNWEPFTPNDWMNEEEKEQLAQLVFEHFIRTKKYAAAVSEVSRIIPQKLKCNELPEENHKNSTEIAFAWYINRICEAKQTREIEFLDHTKKQDTYIEKQHQYIEELHSIINEKNKNINELAETIHSKRTVMEKFYSKIKRTFFSH